MSTPDVYVRCETTDVFSYEAQTRRGRDFLEAHVRPSDVGTDGRVRIRGDAGPVLMIVEGPTRNLIAEYDPDLQLFGGDVSRGAFWGDEEP
jgi:hypothetical protein